MNKLCTIWLLILIIQLSIVGESKALTLDKLPTNQTSKQWSVTIGEAEEDENLAKPITGKFHTYSLKIDNIGKDVLSAEVNMFRNEPNSTTKYSLFGCPDEQECDKGHFEESFPLAKQLNDGFPYTFSNFLLAEEATELEIEIIWTENGSEGRHLKERFIFSSE
ncbi:hypothetical protein [Bacillus sp. JJ722]|uniref:hypothetical protein n=1 Tax=Bacillus sp. JJ722 TaxID=3122973 RepID=UPI0030003540